MKRPNNAITRLRSGRLWKIDRRAILAYIRKLEIKANGPQRK